MSAPPIADLTPGERTVLQRLASGQSPDQIAAALGQTVQHIVDQQRRAVWKLGTDSLIEALIVAIRAGVLRPDPPADWP